MLRHDWQLQLYSFVWTTEHSRSLSNMIKMITYLFVQEQKHRKYRTLILVFFHKYSHTLLPTHTLPYYIITVPTSTLCVWGNVNMWYPCLCSLYLKAVQALCVNVWIKWLFKGPTCLRPILPSHPITTYIHYPHSYSKGVFDFYFPINRLRYDNRWCFILPWNRRKSARSCDVFDFIRAEI